ncbi:DUF4105 domain-containing protein [Dyadobacter sp. CY345]|uniref:lipoprotein N-acyltransferase Lnb domain-containing protein n=1 Tax=Dyadobacter sp. CY345 TaxID=2909335 RepID=UPI001F47FB9C|nr:DUF4105 domain-containing protein [Dyadobacter sp. CY345]MCF2446577.1 DUF4105 domain-containing protein [Dyadobacter sp. CY345]
MTFRIVVFLLLLQLPVFGQVSLSTDAEISIITCGPDQDELYSAFGHSAIRVKDPASGMDLAYNYGVFKFDSKFYLNFTLGALYYKLGVDQFDSFRAFYISQNRYVHEQILNLSPGQKKMVFDYLQENARPENATYRYDYFYNNCATKVRDVFVELFDSQIKFDDTYATSGYTIRMLTGDRLQKQRWGKLAINILLGSPLDKKLTLFEYMYLPDYLESGFDHAMLNGTKIVEDKVIIYNSQKTASTKNLFQPWLVFGIFLVLTAVISQYDLNRNKRSGWLDYLLFPTVGGVGILLLFLWFATDHHAAANNLNLLWAIPTHIFVPIFLSNKRFYSLLKPYLLITIILIFISFPLWIIVSEQFDSDLFTLPVILYIRALTLYRLLKRVS